MEKQAFDSVGFNPCFLGTCPRTFRAVYNRSLDIWFQSLFSWNLPSDYRCHRSHTTTRSHLVSILVFLELALGPNCLGVVVESLCGFNPCFLGTCPRTFTLYTLEYLFRVSILVFLELALGRSDGRQHHRYQGVSILVFLELALGRRSPCL